MKKSKGILHAIRNSSVSTLKPVTADSFKGWLKSLENCNPSLYRVYMNKDNADYMDAVVSGNKSEIKRLNDKFEKQRQEELQKTYDKIISDYSEGVLDVFKRLDLNYSRNMWSHYNHYEWLVERAYLEDDEYDSCDVTVTLKDVFEISVTYSDETGYFMETKERVICAHNDVFDTISRLIENNTKTI